MPKGLRISARQSDLARIQAYQVGDALQALYPGLRIEYHFRASLGDLNQRDPLWKMPERGVFTEDFLLDLTQDRTDLVVHSYKDLPTQDRELTCIAATLPRADSRDVLLLKAQALKQAPHELHLLSSSPRRAFNLARLLPRLMPWPVGQTKFVDVRGNVPTRIQKLLSDESAHGLIVAKAALDRLLSTGHPELAARAKNLRKYLDSCLWMILPLSLNPTAAAQGALAIECLRSREDLRAGLAGIHCSQTEAEVRAERELLLAHGGGCHLKIGISQITTPFGQVVWSRGQTPAGEEFATEELRRAQPRPENKNNLAQPQRLWPPPGDFAGFFSRRKLADVSLPQGRDLWIARAEALPQSWHQELAARAQEELATSQQSGQQSSQRRLLWAAGVNTWRRLAEQGIWLNGCQDGLGELLGTGVEILAARTPNWLKLSHRESEQFIKNSLESCATYELIPRPTAQPPRGFTHYFWMSASQFAWAVEKAPEILGAQHASGPGHTHLYLQKVLEPLGQVAQVYLNLNHWRRELEGE